MGDDWYFFSNTSYDAGHIYSKYKYKCDTIEGLIQLLEDIIFTKFIKYSEKDVDKDIIDYRKYRFRIDRFLNHTSKNDLEKLKSIYSIIEK